MKIARTALTAVALLGAAGAANAATSIVTNGSFENGTDPGAFSEVTPGETDITAWTVGPVSVDYIGSYWQASDGTRSIDLAGLGAGSLSQFLATAVGNIYNLSFDISKNPDGGQVPRLGSVTVGGQTVPLSYSASNTRGDMMWQTVSFNFTAVSASTLLSFAADPISSTSGGLQAFGLALDNVSVVAAPEPTTWALMILGFGIVGSALRRRRHTQVRFNFA